MAVYMEPFGKSTYMGTSVWSMFDFTSTLVVTSSEITLFPCLHSVNSVDCADVNSHDYKLNEDMLATQSQDKPAQVTSLQKCF